MVLSWEDVYSHMVKLCEKILDSGWRPDVIVAIARGGLVPAMVISDVLNVKDILVIQLEHWPAPGTTLPEVKIRHDIPNEDLSGKKILIVDDVADTGDTLKFAKEMIEKRFTNVDVKTAALHVKVGKAKFIPDYSALNVDPGVWIVYPWSCVEDMEALMRKCMSSYGSTVKTVIEDLTKILGIDLSKVPAACIKLALSRIREVE
ncbi:MAG: phosphoribosyltransferase [Crenarchaeota archaeon]|nr:phosphoribosyltransferase [Thermoproteota archaeon]